MDRQTIHTVLKSSNGDFKEAVRNLERLGEDYTEHAITKFIEEDPVLKPIWGDHIMASLTEALAPVKDVDITHNLLRKESQFIAAKGLENCGIKGKTLQKLSSYADFVNRSFDAMVDISHGMSLVNAVQLQEQAENIKENYLLNNKKKIVKKLIDGSFEDIEVPVVGDEDKLKWQTEYTNIMNTLLKFAQFTTDAKLTGAKINKMTQEMEGREKGARRPKRLKAAPSASSFKKKGSRPKPQRKESAEDMEVIVNAL